MMETIIPMVEVERLLRRNIPGSKITGWQKDGRTIVGAVVKINPDSLASEQVSYRGQTVICHQERKFIVVTRGNKTEVQFQ